jgi:hypothetical protein
MKNAATAADLLDEQDGQVPAVERRQRQQVQEADEHVHDPEQQEDVPEGPGVARPDAAGHPRHAHDAGRVFVRARGVREDELDDPADAFGAEDVADTRHRVDQILANEVGAPDDGGDRPAGHPASLAEDHSDAGDRLPVHLREHGDDLEREELPIALHA